MAGPDDWVKFERRMARLGDLCLRHGLAYATVAKRLRRGWPLALALKTPVDAPKPSPRHRAALYSYHGRLLAVRDMVKITGISEPTIRQRLYSGWSVTRAMETPLQKSGRPRKNGSPKSK